jgi:hypothetical protein
MLLRIFTKLYALLSGREAEDVFAELYYSLPFAGTEAESAFRQYAASSERQK